MLFHSLQFMIFLPVAFAIYWAVAGHPTLRKWVLLLASAIFYMAWNPLPFLVVLYAATAAYVVARLMKTSSDPGRKKLWVTAGIVSNLGVLIFFKYANFFYETASLVGSWIGVGLVYRHLDILLPIGLSFVVFQTLSYVIDVYRGDCEARESWVDVSLYICCFPQITSGPIVRASWFLPQLDRPASLNSTEGSAALLRIAKGLVKKLLIADLLAANLVDRVFASPDLYTSLEIWAGVFTYTLQIYYDFSAYSDIAIGAAALFGLKIPENFNRPYKSKDLTEFWRRWHISLSTWLRDYLYIPLGGNRGGRLLTLRNVMITMILGGIWHGASWRMALWGGVHGVGLCLTRLLWWRFGTPENPPWWRVAASFSATFLSVMLARIFFRADSMTVAYGVFKGLVPDGTWQAPNVTLRVLVVMVIAAAIHFGPTNLYARASELFVRLPIPARVLALVAIAIVIKNVANFEAQPFIYFQF